MITLTELHAEKARLIKQRDNAAAVFNQVCGAIMQTDALIMRAEKAQQDELDRLAGIVANDADKRVVPINGSQEPEPPEAA